MLPRRSFLAALFSAPVAAPALANAAVEETVGSGIAIPGPGRDVYSLARHAMRGRGLGEEEYAIRERLRATRKSWSLAFIDHVAREESERAREEFYSLRHRLERMGKSELHAFAIAAGAPDHLLHDCGLID